MAGDGQAALTWKAPPDGGRKIKKYTVRSTPDDITVTVDAPATSTIIGGH